MRAFPRPSFQLEYPCMEHQVNFFMGCDCHIEVFVHYLNSARTEGLNQFNEVRDEFVRKFESHAKSRRIEDRLAAARLLVICHRAKFESLGWMVSQLDTATFSHEWSDWEDRSPQKMLFLKLVDFARSSEIPSDFLVSFAIFCREEFKISWPIP